MFNKFEIKGDVLLRPFDVDMFEVANDVKVECHTEKQGVLTIIVKAGFKTDLASIPLWAQMLTGLRSRGNKYWTLAAICHDFAYSSQSKLHDFSKEFVDDLFYEMMEHMPVGFGSIKRWLVYSAVDKFGHTAWDTFDAFDLETANNKLGSLTWSDK